MRGHHADRGSRPAPSSRGGSSGQRTLAQRGRPARRYRPRYLLGGSGLRTDRHHRHPGRRGRRQDAGDDHRRIPADVLRRLRLPRIQQGRTRLRDVVHLDHQGVRPLRRLARRLGGGPGDHHRAVQPRRRRRAVLLPIHRRSVRQRSHRRAVGEQTGQRGHLPGLPGDRHRRGLPRHHHHRARAVRPGRVPDGRAAAVRRDGVREGRLARRPAWRSASTGSAPPA